MAGPFDQLGGLLQGAEQKVGSFLQGMLPKPTPSAPAQPRSPSLPTPPPSSIQPQKPSSALGAMSPVASSRPSAFGNAGAPGERVGNFMQNTGVTDFWKNFFNQDSSNPNTMQGQMANPSSPINLAQFGLNVTYGQAPLVKAAHYVSNVLNAGVIDPVRLAADPQMWFAENSNQSNVGGAVNQWTSFIEGRPLDASSGHNYLRDVFAPIVKRITGENVPPTMAHFESDAKDLTQQGKSLEAARASLSEASSPQDIIAYNAKLDEFNAKMQEYQSAYDSAQNWWNNSTTAKTLGIAGQIVTFPAGFAAGMATFLPQLAGDPIGTGESIVQQIQMAGNFAATLMNPEARSHMSAQELSANISNVAMLGGMLWGAKNMPKGIARNLGEIRSTVHGPRPEQVALNKVIQDVHDSSPELANPPQAESAITPSIDPMSSSARVKAHQDQLYRDATQIREAMSRAHTPSEREVFQKQLNDITDQITELRTQRKTAPVMAADPSVSKNYEVAQDLGRELQTEQRPEYTKPVYSTGGFPDSQADVMLRDLPDFAQPAIASEAMRKNPQDYASLSSDQPTVSFEGLSPKTIETLAMNNGYNVVPPSEIMGNAWINPNTGKAIDAGEIGHREFVSAMKQPGDSRDPEQVQKDLMKQGWVKVSDFSSPDAPTMQAYSVDMLDSENVKSIQQAIEADMQRRNRTMPYLVNEIGTNRSYNITREAFAANNFNLAKTIAQERRLKLSNQPDLPDKLSPAQIKQAVEYQGWKLVPFNKVEYGWLFPDGKGVDIGLSDASGAHNDLIYGLGEALDMKGPGPMGEVPAQTLQRLSEDWVQLRRGWEKDIDDHYFFAEKWSPTTIKTVEDYLQSKTKDHPTFIMLESREGKHAAITWEEFKENDFKLEGLWGRAPIGKIDLINPQEDLNEKGYPTPTTPGTKSTSSQTGEGYYSAPPGAPEGTALTTIGKGPDGQTSVAFWSSNPKSSGAVSALERGRLELEQNIRDTVNAALQADPNLNLPEPLRSVSVNPVNVARRIKEFTSTVKVKMADLDPLGIATFNHVIFDPKLPVEAQYDPYTGMISFNPARSVPETWIHALGITLGRGLARWKLDNREPLSIDQLQYAKNYIDNQMTATQAERDFSAVAEEVLHKYDTDYFNIKEYFDSLLTLPQEWWDHALRSGIGDQVDGGIDFWASPQNALVEKVPAGQVGKVTTGERNEVLRPAKQGQWLKLKTKDGQVVNSWIDGFNLGRMDKLDSNSLNAVFSAFAEYRVQQLLNYHGVKARSGYTYRVPEVFFREFENPALVEEGARLGGSSFEQYVQANTAHRMAAPIPPEEAALSQRSAETSTASTTIPAGALAPVSSSATPRVPGRNARNQENLTQDFPQVGDILQIGLGNEKKPEWVTFWDNPIRDDLEAQKASRIVSTRGQSDVYSSSKFSRPYRVINPRTGAIRVFRGSLPETPPVEPGVKTDFNDLPSTGQEQELTTTFHGISTPEVDPVNLTGKLAEVQPRAQRVPPPAYEKIPPRSIGSAVMFRPIEELQRTGYPGGWEDFLRALSGPDNDVAYQTALEYWDKLSPRWQKAWMQAVNEPGVERGYINREAERPSDVDVSSPVFIARQQKITQYREEIQKSGPVLDRLSRSVNTKTGLDKYNQLKAATAAKIKYVELSPNIPELEATQLMGQEYSRAMSELTDAKSSVALPDDVKLQKNTRDLIDDLQPNLRSFLQSRVAVRDALGKLDRTSYPTVERFIDAYAGGEENAKKIYNGLPKMSKEAIRNIVAQMPTSLQVPSRMRLDQTSVPESQQTNNEHINPTPLEDFRAMVDTASKVLVRHGSTEYNEKGLIRSHDNPPLSSLGRLQARNVATAFRGRRKLQIVSHDLSRAHETAIRIAQSAYGSKVTTDENLRPWNVGDQLRGASSAAGNPIMMKWMLEQPDYVPAGGESFNQFKTRFIDALKQYIFNSDALVMSTRNLRLAEDWISQGMPAAEEFQPSAAMRTVREIGPGGIVTLSHQQDGTLTVQGKASQMPSKAENLAITKVRSTLPTRPQKVTVKARVQPEQQVQVPRSVQPSVDQEIKTNIKIGENARQRAAAVRGEVVSPARTNVDDQVEAVISDPSVLASEPIKISAMKAKLAREAISFAKAKDVPPQVIQRQEQEYNNQVKDFSAKIAQRAKDEEKAAPIVAPRAENSLVFDVSVKKAQDHLNRIAQGEDYAASASQAARELGFAKKSDPIGDTVRVIKDAAQGLLPTGHEAYSFSPAFKDVFVNPKALELIKSEGLSEPSKQGLLPFRSEVNLGSNVSDSASIPKVTQARPNVVRAPKVRNPVVPAEAETLAAHTPATRPPEEIHPREAVKRYKEKVAQRNKMSTKDLRSETKQVHDKINTESPDLFIDDDLEAEGQDAEEAYIAAERGSTPPPSIPTTKTGGRGGGGRKKPPFEPLKAWDDARDFALSLGGDMRSLALRYDYGLKLMTNLFDPSVNTSHPKGMANAFQHARTEAVYVGDEKAQLIDKILPMETPDDLARHQNIAKAVGGDNEGARQQALDVLTDQDKALANLFHAYHDVMGQLGARVESHLWDEAQDNYFPRRVLFDEDGKTPIDSHGNVRWSKKMDIAYARKKRETVTGMDSNGNPIKRTVNYYKDNEDLKAQGFKVEENIGKLQQYHWNQFSNMMLTHQFIKVLSTLHSFEERSIKPSRYGLGDKGLGGHGLPKSAEPYRGRVLVPTSESVAGKTKATQIATKYKDQLTHVTKGPFAGALTHYWVYKPVAEQLERMVSTHNADNFGEQIAGVFANANNTFKVFKFGFNPIHLYNLLSNVYALGSDGLLDRATYNPLALHHRIYGRVDSLLQDKSTYKNWDGEDIVGKDVIAKVMHWGGVLPKELIDVNNLGGLTGVLSRKVPGFKQWHNFMWQQVAWKGQLGLTLHLLDVMRTELAKPEVLGRGLNEAEFENAGRLATQMSNYAMGFISKEKMTRDWQVYGNAAFLANSWTLSQLRMMGMALPKSAPGRKFLANIGGAERYNDIVTEQMKGMGGMTQEGLNAINGFEGKIARKLMLGGALKLLAASTILTYLGSYLGNSGQAQGPWQNFQRDPTHTFDIYLGTDPATLKDKWAHNPMFGMQQELALYGLQAMKTQREGGNAYDIFGDTAGRISNKLNPITATTFDIAVNRNLSLYLQGYGDRSALDKDSQVIAIRRALDATGKNPFPESFTNNVIYAIRTLFPSPGFPERLDTSHGTSPAMTNATAGNTLNALGPGKVFGIGDLMNAVQGGQTSPAWGDLVKKDLGGLAQWMLGSRISTSATPEAIANQNLTSSAIATQDQKNQAISDMVQAFQSGNYAQAAEIVSKLGLTNSELIQALEHPPKGFGAGPGVIYSGLPQQQQTAPAHQDVLQGVTLDVAHTADFEALKQAHTIALMAQITKLPEFQQASGTERTSMLAAYTTLVDGMVSDQYAQQLGLLGGTPITNADIEGALNTAIEFRGTAFDTLSQMDLYAQTDDLGKQRMRATFESYAISLAKSAYNGDLRNVPIENVRDILNYTITAEESSREFLQNSMYYQLTSPQDQQRMTTEYSALARAMAKREALGQGQGSYAFQIPPDKVIPTIEFIMNVEELGKASLHGTDFYASGTPTEQTALDTKMETLARGLAFSTSAADPRVLIQNMLNSQQSYFDLQNQFGGSTYIKLMAQQLADLERNVRTSSDYSPRQIAAMERAIRTQFLAHNPAYAAWLRSKTQWQKYTANGQIYEAMNNSEYAAVDDMQSAGVISANYSLLSSSPVSSSTSLEDPGTGSLGLPPVNYDTFRSQNS